MPSIDAVKVLLAGRSGMYRLLQNTLGNEPSAEMLDQALGEPAQRVFEVFSDDHFEFAQATESLIAKAAAYKADKNVGLDRLGSCFTYLFVGPAMPEAPPWASYYLSTNPMLFQKITLEVRKHYVAQGLLPAAYPNVADDNIGIELDFLARLAERAETAFNSCDATSTKQALGASESFLNEHLMKWAPKFSATVAKAKHAEFYSEAAVVLEAFLPIDIEALRELQAAI